MQMNFIDKNTIEVVEENESYIDYYVLKEFVVNKSNSKISDWKIVKLTRTEKCSNQEFEITVLQENTEKEEKEKMYTLYFEYKKTIYSRTMSLETINGDVYIKDDIIIHAQVLEISEDMRKMISNKSCCVKNELGEKVYVNDKTNKAYSTRIYRDWVVEKEINEYMLDPNTDTKEIPYLTNLIVRDFNNLSKKIIPFDQLNQISFILEKEGEKTNSKILM